MRTRGLPVARRAPGAAGTGLGAAIVVVLLLLPANPAGPVRPRGSVAPPSPPPPGPPSVGASTAVVGTHPGAGIAAQPLNVSVTYRKLAMDLGESFGERATVAGGPLGIILHWYWVGLPPGVRVNGSAAYAIVGVPKVVGIYTINVTVNGSVNGTFYQGTNGTILTVNSSLLVHVGSVPSEGTAPLTVTLVAQASGGCPPYTASWYTGDGNVAIGRAWNHTYSAPGTYRAEVWVNDTTAVRSSLGSYHAFVNITVTGAHAGRGPFGLPGPYGYVVVAGLALVVVVGVTYGVATRRRPRALPRPERWMVAGTEGRAGGLSTERPGAPPKFPPPG